jgi:hypothetical protein
MKTYGGVDVEIHVFLYLGTSWRCMVSITLLPLYPRGRSRSTHSIRGWVDPRTGLDNVEKKK